MRYVILTIVCGCASPASVAAPSAETVPQARATARPPSLPTHDRVPPARADVAPLLTGQAAGSAVARPGRALTGADAERVAMKRVLDRFTFGVSEKLVEGVATVGLDRWFEQQLSLGSTAVAARYKHATLKPVALIEANSMNMMGESGADEAIAVADKRKRKKVKINFRVVADALAMAQLTRQVQSEHQVAEVMADFWMNHFNVFARKGDVKLYAGHFVEHAIRPFVLGKFEDLVIGTAKHPAMLLYLDNAKSRAALTGKALRRAQRRNARRIEQNKKPRRLRDVNENYARELLELHTVGLRHSQADVVAVARALTGWGVKPVQEGGGYRFRDEHHDQGAKTVLGQTFGSGEKAGLDMLRFLARHPATGRHLGEKLCRRFVSDAPPSRCVEAVAAAHQASGGEIATMLRAVYAEVKSGRGVTEKLKTPHEFLVSALRAVDATPTGPQLARVLKKLGQPVLMMPVPTGYPEIATQWDGSTAMLRRMNTAAAIGRGRLKGAKIELDRIFPATTKDLVSDINDRVLRGSGSDATLAVIRRQIDGVRNKKKARRIALTLALGSPEFLRQ